MTRFGLYLLFSLQGLFIASIVLMMSELGKYQEWPGFWAFFGYMSGVVLVAVAVLMVDVCIQLVLDHIKRDS